MICSKDSKDSIALASECLRAGGIAILPTDTVYGFSGIVDLRGGEKFLTDSKIRVIKGREENKPLIQLISHPDEIYCYTDVIVPQELLDLWPGALTIIVPLKSSCPIETDCKTVAFRCPGDEWLRNVIERVSSPIFSTSVNKSGFPVLDSAEEIKRVFAEEVDLFVEDGDKKGALPSTIVRLLDDGSYEVLREGSVKI